MWASLLRLEANKTNQESDFSPSLEPFRSITIFEGTSIVPTTYGDNNSNSMKNLTEVLKCMH